MLYAEFTASEIVYMVVSEPIPPLIIIIFEIPVTTTTPSITNINHFAFALSLYVINVTPQISNELISSNYLQRLAQFDALLVGCNLLRYADGTLKCPSLSSTAINTSTFATITISQITRPIFLLYFI